MRIDLHTHSNVSDGTDSPTQLVHQAVGQRLDVIALTDHDTFGGVAEAKEAGRRMGLVVVTGVEMSTKAGGASTHLLGYGCDPYHRPLAAELMRLRGARGERLPRMVARSEELGVPLTEAEVMAEVGESPSIGRPHVADAMIKKGYVASRGEAFDRYLHDGGPLYVERYATPIGQAIDLIHGAGGVAVVAHPWGHGSRDVMTRDLLTALVRDHGLEGIEVDHQDHDQHMRDQLFAMGGQLGLVRTGSSDYHGDGKVDHDLGCNLTRESAYLDLVRRIRERGGAI